MNIAITCAGRRSYLVRYFQEALDGAGKVIAINSISESSSMYAADFAVVAPSIYSDSYVDFLLETCKTHKIGLLFSVFDLELPILAAAKDRFTQIGVVLAVSDSTFIDISFDKLKTASFISDQVGLNVPMTTCSLVEAEQWLADGKLSFPLFVKPRFGMGSIGIYKVITIEELRFFYARVLAETETTYLDTISSTDTDAAVLIQSALPGEEYGLDIVNDFNGQHRATFVKKKIAMRSGETDSAVTIESMVLKEAAKRIALASRHIGNLDVDAFLHGDQVYILEMNPRFGGGYPFSHLAGARVPDAYIAWAKGTEPSVGWDDIRIGVTGLKEIQPIEIPV